MLKSRNVDMVTCWSDHLVSGLKKVGMAGSAAAAMQNKVIEYRAAIHEIFLAHDKDKTGFIDGDEQYEFSVDVAKLMVPVAGPERDDALNKIWDTMVTIDKDGDQRIS